MRTCAYFEVKVSGKTVTSIFVLTSPLAIRLARFPRDQGYSTKIFARCRSTGTTRLDNIQMGGHPKLHWLRGRRDVALNVPRRRVERLLSQNLVMDGARPSVCDCPSGWHVPLRPPGGRGALPVHSRTKVSHGTLITSKPNLYKLTPSLLPSGGWFAWASMHGL